MDKGNIFSDYSEKVLYLIRIIRSLNCMKIYFDKLLVISVKLPCSLISLQLHFFWSFKFKTL